MREVFNVVDTGSLALLAQSDNLDLLVAGGRKVIITLEVLTEATVDPNNPRITVTVY